jgi:hypothetical protein
VIAEAIGPWGLAATACSRSWPGARNKDEGALRRVLRATVESLALTLPTGELRRHLGAAAEGLITTV